MALTLLRRTVTKISSQPISNHLLCRSCKATTTQNSISKQQYLSFLSPVRAFHVSRNNHALPVLAPLLVKLASPLTRFAAVLAGRRARKWWKNLPQEARDKYLRRHKKRIYKGVAGFCGCSALYYAYHLQETPLSGRKRFIILSSYQLKEIADKVSNYLMESLSEKRLPVTDRRYIRVARIAQRILQANNSKEVSALSWEVNVIDDDDVMNAFVLPNGQIFVFTGILNQVSNDHELAGVMGHEMAHAILNHGAEQISRTSFLNIFGLIVVTAIWALIPVDPVALVVHLLQDSMEDAVVHLPYSRLLENEADSVGLVLAARACYDVRHVPVFWERMYQIDKESGAEEIEWLSTHPSHASRVANINQLLPEALKEREEVQCPAITRFWQGFFSLR